jgi:DNA modification methylase
MILSKSKEKTYNMANEKFLSVNEIHCGDSCQLMYQIEPDTIAVSIWSPPYHVGKDYEAGQTYDEWLQMLREVIKAHYQVLKPGGFLAINIGDILCFADPTMPRIQAENVSNRKCAVTREDVLKAKEEHPDYNRYQLAALLGCSEQTIDRRLNGNNIRGGKYSTQTRVKIVGGLIEEMGLDAGLYPYDRRIWVKDPAWANCNWTQNSYRSVDEFEYIYIFWKPGITKVDRNRLTKKEWSEWGSRAVWNFASVRRNDIHEAMFPLELPRRLIKLLTDPGEIVLDPFMGSGTTALAAIDLGRRYIGIDKEQKYVKLAQENIQEFTRQIRLDI